MHVSHYLSKIISYVIGLDLEFHSHSREKVQCFETRLRIIFLTLTWRDEIEIIIWSFLYFETRTRLHIVILMFRDKTETLENHFLWSSEKKWSLLSSRIPGIENSRWTLIERHMNRPWGKRELVRVNDDQGWCLMVVMMMTMPTKVEKCENTWEEERTGQGWCSLRSSAMVAPSRAQDLQDVSSTLERREYQQLSNTNTNTWWSWKITTPEFQI